MHLKRKAMERRDKNDNIKKEKKNKKKRQTSSPRARPIPPRLSKLASHLEKIISFGNNHFRPTFDNDDNQCVPHPSHVMMSFMNTEQLIKSVEEYLDYLEGGWSGQILLLVVCWRKPSFKPEKENYYEVEEVFKYMQQDLIESKEKAGCSTLVPPLGTPRLLSS